MRLILALALTLALSIEAWLPASGQGTPPGGLDAGSAVLPGVDARRAADAKKTPAPLLNFALDAVFTLALGGDDADDARIAVAVAQQMEHASTRQDLYFVPEGSWNVGDFIDQCAKDPVHTRGAIIVLPPSSDNRAENYLVLIRSEERLAFNAMVAVCKPDGTADVEWESKTVEGEYGRSVIQFLPLAVLTSVYLAFAPSRTYTTAMTTQFPVTAANAPKSGGTSQIVQTATATNNNSGQSQLQNNIVNAVGFAQLLFGKQGQVNHYTVHVANDAVGKFIVQLKGKCATLAPPDSSAASGYCTWL